MRGWPLSAPAAPPTALPPTRQVRAETSAAAAAGALFVGRERDLAALAEALARGAHALVEGRFGMGRTALLRHLQATRGAAWRIAFADADLAPAGLCTEWWRELHGGAPGASAGPAKDRRASRAAVSGRPSFTAVSGRPSFAGLSRRPSFTGLSRRPSFAALRAALLRLPAGDRRPHVLVLDGVSRLTPARMDLVRRLAGAGFRLVAVVEHALSRADRLRLAAWLAPACRVELAPLPVSDAELYFARLAAARGLAWSREVVRALARSSCGYPLRMHELAVRALEGQPTAAAPRRSPP